MKITVQKARRRFVLYFPTGLLISRFTLWILRYSGNGNFGKQIKGRELRQLRKTVRRMKKLYPNVDLLDVTADEWKVELKL